MTGELRLSLAKPSLLDMRNAILQAYVNRGFRDCDRIWAAFAARGMGLNAQTAGDNDTAPVEDFTAPPPACPPSARDTTAIGKWALHGGRHRATISARDAAGNRSKRRYASFAILRR